MSPATAERPLRREIELDFIRGIAILLVIDFHSRYSLSSFLLGRAGMPALGWVGVDLFFVLSGFLVGGLLIKEWKVRGRIDSSHFLIRRGLKIWPQYYVYLLALLLTGRRSVHELWGNLLNIQNYVGGVAHTWSLAVEEHAYLIILLVLALAARYRLRMRTLFAIFGVLIACAVALGFLLMRVEQTFLLTHTRLGGILAGVMVAIVYHYRPEIFHRLQRQRWLWCAILVGCFAAIYIERHSWTTPFLVDLADISAVAALMLLYRHREGRQRGRLYRGIAWIGLYSYGIYLWHVSVDAPVALVAKWMHGTPALVWGVAAPVILGIAVGVLTTEAIEFPMLRLRERWFPRRVASAVGTPAEEAEKSASESDAMSVPAGAKVL